jgi:hypothetical protein
VRLRSGKDGVRAGNVVPRLCQCVHAIARAISIKTKSFEAAFLAASSLTKVKNPKAPPAKLTQELDQLPLSGRK